ncbi:Hypothetical predicted protein [Olea europaea subsp. europaea]|uniref:Uncharacterized protein n=1 Tax=Olea europaea subsp. europaea TaxID=158383 RepID=A0A8S0R530_OLEEU|nr:Hypothetical predicted protein [Olea europaea subsp. europaea]
MIQRHPESISYAIDIASVERQLGDSPDSAIDRRQHNQHSAEADARRRAKEDKIRGELTVSPSPSLTGRPDCVNVERGVTVASRLHSRESRRRFLNFHMNYFGNLGIGLDLIWINGLMGWDLCIVGLGWV